jgi:hypothetical protein
VAADTGPDDPRKEKWLLCVGIVNDKVAAASRAVLSHQVGIQATIGTLLVLEIDFGQKERLFVHCPTTISSGTSSNVVLLHDTIVSILERARSYQVSMELLVSIKERGEMLE